jgi:hypothetical protein
MNAQELVAVTQAPRRQIDLKAWISGPHLKDLARLHFFGPARSTDDGLGTKQTCAVQCHVRL